MFFVFEGAVKTNHDQFLSQLKSFSLFPILYLLKIPENRWFFGVLRGYKMGTLAKNGIKHLKSFYYPNFKKLENTTVCNLRLRS